MRGCCCCCEGHAETRSVRQGGRQGTHTHTHTYTHTHEHTHTHTHTNTQGLTATSDGEKTAVLDMLLTSTGGTNRMHESFDANNPRRFTRKWFAWANALFAEFVREFTDECR